MLIFEEHNEPILIENINTPTISDSFWVLDLAMLDFTLTPLMVLEEIVASSIELYINGFRFVLPAIWNILVIDPETLQLDVVEIADVAGSEFKAFLYGPAEPRFEMTTIYVTNYLPTYVSVGPSLNKHQMLCHPVAPHLWVNVAPSDTYNKYLKGLVAGNLT